MEKLKNNNDFIIGKRNLESEHHWERIEDDEYVITRPTVLILGGDGTETELDANGYAKWVGNFFRPFIPDVDILSVAYNEEGLEGYNYTMNINKLLKTIFLPLVSREGKRLPLEEACKNARMLTIFSHCQGTDIFNKIIKKLMAEMKELGYSEKEINKICEQFFLIAYASEVADVPPNVKCVYGIAGDDWRFSRDVDYLWNELESEHYDDKSGVKDIKILQYLSASNHRYTSERCYIVKGLNNYHTKLPNTIFILSSPHGNRELGHSITLIVKDEDWQSSQLANETAGHVSLAIGIAMSKSIANSMENARSDELIELDLNDMFSGMNETVKEFNGRFKMK